MENLRFKFRVWSKDSSQYIEKECHSCCLFHNGQLDCYNLKDGDCDCMYDNYPEDDLIIEQCTGLKDKDGKLIYEGDIIVKSDVSAIGYSRTRVCKVHWHNDWLSWAITTQYGDTYELSEFEPKQYEIIGNIHENADLLGESK